MLFLFIYHQILSCQRCQPMVDVGQFNAASQCEGSALVSFSNRPTVLILSGRNVSCCFQVEELYFMPRTIKNPFRYNGDPPYGLRGYLDDRVNRIIGFALVRQIREIPGNCRSPKLMRDYVDSCTGDLLVMIPM